MGAIRRLGLVAVLLAPWGLVARLGLMPVGRRRTAPAPPVSSTPPSRWHGGRPGPWGELQRLEIQIEPPEADITPELCDPRPDRWVFPEQTPAAVRRLLAAAALTDGERGALLAHLRCAAEPGRGCVIDPPVATLVSMSAAARAAIYDVLAHYPDNDWCQFGFTRASGDPAADLAAWLGHAGLEPRTEEVLRRLTWRHGGLLLFSDLAAACVQIPDPVQRAHAVRVLTRTPALLLRLHVRPDADADALAEYWALPAQRKQAFALLESLRAAPGGGTVDVVHLLPPFARRHLYTYPSPGDPPRDCHWSAANFHGSAESDRFLDPRRVAAFLAAEFREVPFAERRFGDVLTFHLDDRVEVHAAVYVADDVVFTKNGQTFSDPWILMSLEDVRALYAPDDRYRIRALRRR